ncbi:MAG TPA: hypothetical protein VIL46_09365 [Gemmataceae bacterium]
MRLRLTAGSLPALLLLAGCSPRLNDERTFALEPGEERTLTIDPIDRDQTVKVRVDSPGVPVNVYCFLEKDRGEVEKAVGAPRPSDKVLARKEKAEAAELEVAVPAGERAAILLTPASGKTANVAVKITN